MSHRNSDDTWAAAARRALALMMQALDMIDGFGGSPAAAAHLQMAIASLRDALGERSAADWPIGPTPI